MYLTHPQGIWYAGTQWSIFNQNMQAMPANAAFVVVPFGPGRDALLHRAELPRQDWGGWIALATPPGGFQHSPAAISRAPQVSNVYVRGADNDPDNPTSPGERFGFVYEINYLRCIHCDLCVEACPTEAITESKLFEFSFTNRQDAIYTKSELLVDESGKPQQLPWEDWREGEDTNTSGWMRAAAPNGDATFRGVVAWSGERGYGVRPAEPPQDEADA